MWREGWYLSNGKIHPALLCTMESLLSSLQNLLHYPKWFLAVLLVLKRTSPVTFAQDCKNGLNYPLIHSMDKQERSFGSTADKMNSHRWNSLQNPVLQRASTKSFLCPLLFSRTRSFQKYSLNGVAFLSPQFLLNCSTITIHPSESESNVFDASPHRNQPPLIVGKEFSLWLRPTLLFLFVSNLTSDFLCQGLKVTIFSESLSALDRELQNAWQYLTFICKHQLSRIQKD